MVSACPNPMQIPGLVLVSATVRRAVSEGLVSRQSPGLDSPDPP
jgi:hypothetical protein